ncbi:hypothetical protein [Streptomyces sp. NPDC085665]|uniref:hypothetical protein n=1 Tax=Streptomyces sp. NPDC085665 TaxID=3365735 RepID=UPI0037CD7798
MDGSTRLPSQLGDRSRTAHHELTRALAGRPLIDFDRHTTGGRVAYAAPVPVSAARPTLSLGCYSPWGPAAPAEAIAAEHGTGERPAGERKHTWWATIAARAAARIESLGKPPVIAGWYAVPYLQTLAGPAGIVAGLPVNVRSQIEDKSAIGRILRSAQVPAHMIIGAHTYRDRLPNLTDMRNQIGSRRIVVQSAHSAGGRGTVFVNDEGDMHEAAALPGPWRVSAFVEGWSSNTTVLSLPDGRGGVRIYVDRPSHKAIGVEAVGIGPAKSAGNDWSQPWPITGAADVIEAATRIGQWAWREHRLTGLWGIDTIWTPAGPVINEINARKQGTTEVSGVNQQLSGFPPLVLAHLTAMLDHPVTWLPSPQEFNTATITAAAGGVPAPYYLKIRARQALRLPDDFPGSGIYRLSRGRLTWEGPGAHPADADSDTGRVLIANAPAAGTTCPPGAELATAEGITIGSASPFAGPSELSPHGRTLLAAFDRLTNHAEGTNR